LKNELSTQPGYLTPIHFSDESTLEIIPLRSGDSGYDDFSTRHRYATYIVRAEGVDKAGILSNA
jgi:hypothetical protein